MIPWDVRVAIAFYREKGWRSVPKHLLMAVQMYENGEGCASCRAGAHPQPLEA